MEEIWAASQQQAILRVLIVVSLVVFAASTLMAGTTSVWALIVLALLGLGCAVNPHSALPATVLVYALGMWAVGVPPSWSMWSLVASLSVLVFHTACALAAATPAQAPVPVPVFARYAVRMGLIAGVTLMLWGVAAAVEANPGGGVLAGVVGLVVLSAGLWALYLQSLRTGNEAQAPAAGAPTRG